MAALTIVSSEALDALIEYADYQRSVADSEFCCSLSEGKESKREFDELVKSLSQRELEHVTNSADPMAWCWCGDQHCGDGPQ